VTLQGAASSPTTQASVFALIFQSLLRNVFNLVLVLVLCFVILFFPREDFVQWAARKPLLRRIFDFKDVKLGA